MRKEDLGDVKLKIKISCGHIQVILMLCFIAVRRNFTIA